MPKLSDSVQYLKGVGPKRAALLEGHRPGDHRRRPPVLSPQVRRPRQRRAPRAGDRRTRGGGPRPDHRDAVPAVGRPPRGHDRRRHRHAAHHLVPRPVPRQGPPDGRPSTSSTAAWASTAHAPDAAPQVRAAARGRRPPPRRPHPRRVSDARGPPAGLARPRWPPRPCAWACRWSRRRCPRRCGGGWASRTSRRPCG